jgi:hypothetical protein
MIWIDTCSAYPRVVPSLRDVRVRLLQQTEDCMRTESKNKDTKWIKRWHSWISPTKVLGVWKRKDGGYLVRGRSKDLSTGKSKEIRKVLLVADEATALKWL